MDTTGATYRQPAAKPAGRSPGPHIRNSASRSRQGGGSTGRRDASTPGTSVTPVAGSADNARIVSSVSKLHAATRGPTSTRDGLHVAPAAKDVVAGPVPEAQILTLYPASARQTAVVSPDTPAPMTSTSSASRWSKNADLRVS